LDCGNPKNKNPWELFMVHHPLVAGDGRPVFEERLGNSNITGSSHIEVGNEISPILASSHSG